MQNCRNVIIESITVVETIGWSIHLDNCEDVFVEGVIVRNPTQEIIRNADGIDINGCRNVTVLNCDIETGDDAICLKNIDYTDNKTRLDYPRPDMYNISVYNCKMASTCNCAKIGTETVGNIYNVSFEKIQIFKYSGVNHDNQNKSSGTLGAPISAISVQSNDGGAVYNVKFKDIYAEEVDTPIFIECQCRDYYTKNNQNGYISDVEIDGLYVKKCYRNSQVISEKHGKINNVSISRVFAESYEAPNLEYHYRLKPINGYPDPENYGKFPAFGLFSINSKNVKIDKNVVFVDSGKSGRDAIIVENEHE